MTVIVPFLTTARTEFTSVGPVLTRLFVAASQTIDHVLALLKSLTLPSARTVANQKLVSSVPKNLTPMVASNCAASAGKDISTQKSPCVDECLVEQRRFPGMSRSLLK